MKTLFMWKVIVMIYQVQAQNTPLVDQLRLLQAQALGDYFHDCELCPKISDCRSSSARPECPAPILQPRPVPLHCPPAAPHAPQQTCAAPQSAEQGMQ